MDIDLLICIFVAIAGGLLVFRKTYIDGIKVQEAGKLERTRVARESDKLMKELEIRNRLEMTKLELGQNENELGKLVEYFAPLIINRMSANKDNEDEVQAVPASDVGFLKSVTSDTSLRDAVPDSEPSMPSSKFEEFVKSGAADRLIEKYGKYLK